MNPLQLPNFLKYYYVHMETNDKRSLKSFFVESGKMSPTDWLVDFVIALGAFGFGILLLTFSVNVFLPNDFMRRAMGVQSVAPSEFAVLAMAATCAPLVLRRRFPWIVLLLSTALWVVFDVQMDPLSFSLVAPLVALFTVAYVRPNGEALFAGAIVLVAVSVTAFTSAQTGSSTLGSMTLAQNIALTIAVTFGGYALHTRQEYLVAAEARAAEAEQLRKSEARRAEAAEAMRESEAERRVEEERVRIAREVHDITAHSLSAVSIQAAVAERLVKTDPEGAAEAIATVRKTAKDALDEMRVMVGVLRSGEAAASAEDAERTPTQGTDHLVDLAEYLGQAGVECDLNVSEYDRAKVPAYIDVALFGIAREAATNIVRHANATQAEIELRTKDAQAELIVVDNGDGFPEEALDKGGHGVEGMRERAHVLGGTFKIENRENEGTSISVTVPLVSRKAGK